MLSLPTISPHRVKAHVNAPKWSGALVLVGVRRWVPTGLLDDHGDVRLGECVLHAILRSVAIADGERDGTHGRAVVLVEEGLEVHRGRPEKGAAGPLG